MKHVKRGLSIFLAALFMVLSATVACCEPEWTFTIRYNYDASTQTLSIGKNSGSDSVSIKSTASAEITDKLFGMPSLKQLIIDQSIDDLQGTGASPFTAQFEFRYFPEPIIDQTTHSITRFSYPERVFNYSMSSLYVPVGVYLLTQDGRKVRDTDTYWDFLEPLLENACANLTIQERFDVWDDLQKQLEPQAVEAFNRYYNTNFNSAEECYGFIVKGADGDYEYFLERLPVHIFCRKDSEQQRLLNELGRFYFLFDSLINRADHSTGIRSAYNPTAFGVPVNMTVSKVDSSDEKTVSYDISYVDENGNKVQPNEAIEISLPIPDGWDANDIQVRHEKDDGTSENLEFVVNDNNAVFYTSSCSVFSLVNTAGVGAQTDKPETSATEPTTQPPKEETKPTLNFFQRIIQWFKNLFAKLFGR